MNIEDLVKKNQDELNPYVYRYTHCEIHPSVVYGVLASLIPFPDHSQSPRNTYQCLHYKTPVMVIPERHVDSFKNGNEYCTWFDFEYVPICDVKVGDNVLSFDPNNPSATIVTKVVNQYVKEADEDKWFLDIKIPLIIDDTNNGITFPNGISIDYSESFKEFVEDNINFDITVTMDHKIYTSEGWCEAKDLKPFESKVLLNLSTLNAIEEKYSLEMFDDIYRNVEPIKRDGNDKYEFYITIGDIHKAERCLIADITTESENHSFYANGIGVHNSAMGKQAIGVNASNYQDKMETLSYTLHYPEKPLVYTKMSKYLSYRELPIGRNAIVAIMIYTGYNQEDSVIINQSAIDRGLFHSTFYRTYKDDEKRIQSSGQEEIFGKSPAKHPKGRKAGSYEYLDEEGFIQKDVYVNGGDAIIGKMIPIKGMFHGDYQVFKDASTTLRMNEEGYVDKVVTDVNADGFNFCKVKMRSMREPEIGDKFASRNGQKGTVGMTYLEEDMPYTADGMKPDIIMNPHAIPSRMTMGQLMECLLGRLCPELGIYSDCTPFSDVTVEDIAKVLESIGMNRYGDEVLYNGQTGEQMNCLIFIGPTFYQRLKHMVKDKLHARSSGPMVLMTRQPAEGRSRDGGLRLGEMERDCLLTHGTNTFLKERTLDFSDNYRVFVCDKCGLPGIVNPTREIFSCRGCQTDNSFSEVRVPYAFKLLMQELQGMAILPRLIVE
jgi:DNA-directed RNA polymerase beta subunit